MSRTPFADALAERDRILTAMDAAAAKTFIAQHGGFVPKRPIDWVRVLHLARLEVQSLPAGLVWESRIYLAKNGALTVATLPPMSPYARAALDLLCPPDITDAMIAAETSR